MKVELKKLENLINQLKPVFTAFNNQRLSEEYLAEFFSSVISIVMPKAESDQRYAAWTVFGILLNTVATLDNMRRCIFRLYSFLPEIKAGIAPSLWRGNQTEAVMKVEYVAPAQERKGKAMLQVNMVCIAGFPAGLKFSTVLSRNLLEFIMGKKLGISFKKYNAPAEEIAGCMFKCLVSENSVNTQLSDYSANQFMKEHNQKLAEARISMKKCKTPMLPCASCKKSRKECRLAVWK